MKTFQTCYTFIHYHHIWLILTARFW